jgi:hypothetical protein
LTELTKVATTQFCEGGGGEGEPVKMLGICLLTGPQSTARAGIFKKSMGARHRGGIGFSYRPARLHRLAEFIPWNQCRGPINI